MADADVLTWVEEAIGVAWEFRFVLWRSAVNTEALWPGKEIGLRWEGVQAAL